MHKLCWGEIGLKPYDYYCLTTYELECIIEGWKKREAKRAALVRKQTQIIYAVWGGKEDLTRYWPIEILDGETALKRLTKRKIHNIMNIARKRELERRLLNGGNPNSLNGNSQIRSNNNR